MLLDAHRGQAIEVEVILGEVVRMAKVRGVSIYYVCFLCVHRLVCCIAANRNIVRPPAYCTEPDYQEE